MHCSTNSFSRDHEESDKDHTDAKSSVTSFQQIKQVYTLVLIVICKQIPLADNQEKPLSPVEATLPTFLLPHWYFEVYTTALPDPKLQMLVLEKQLENSFPTTAD